MRFFSSTLSTINPRSRLLVGVDEERKQIACGLVDTIGQLPFSIYPIEILIV